MKIIQNWHTKNLTDTKHLKSNEDLRLLIKNFDRKFWTFVEFACVMNKFIRCNSTCSPQFLNVRLFSTVSDYYLHHLPRHFDLIKMSHLTFSVIKPVFY